MTVENSRKLPTVRVLSMQKLYCKNEHHCADDGIIAAGTRRDKMNNVITPKCRRNVV